MTTHDQFEILGELGRGGSGTVFRARDRLSGRVVALKVFELARGEQAAQRWQRETEILSRLRHPGILRVLGSGHSGPQAWIAAELIEGGSLQDRLDQARALPAAQAVSLVAQAARTLSFAHEKGVIHLDIKPANLLLAADGSPRITDFGVACPAGQRSPGQERGYFLGTPAFIAPEQLLGRPVDARADIYSLGVVLYRCLTGQFPFPAASARELVHRALHDDPVPPSRWAPLISPQLEALCLKAMARRPEQRFRDALSLARALEEQIVLPDPRGGRARAGGRGAGLRLLLWCLAALVLAGLVSWLGGRPG